MLGLPQYRQVVEETIDYVLRELRHPDGGFYSAEDADSPDEHGHGVEGLFYTWTAAEFRAALAGADDQAVLDALQWFGITEQGNFEGRSIPNRLEHRGRLQRTPAIEQARRQLLEARSRDVAPVSTTRSSPSGTRCSCTPWPMRRSRSSATTGRPPRSPTASSSYASCRAPGGRWSRSWQSDGRPRARHDALAADHAALIEAFIRLAELTGQARWIEAARHTADTMLDWYWDPQQGGLYTTAEDREALVVRQKDLLDNATPSANSSAAHGLLRLSALTGETRYQNHADRILQLLATVIEQAPGGTSNALSAIELRHRGLVELAIVGEAPELVRVAQVLWRPDLVLAWGEPYDSPLWQGRSEGRAYMCRDDVCDAPVSTPEALYEKITGRPVPEGLSVGQARLTAVDASAHQPPRWMICSGGRPGRLALIPLRSAGAWSDAYPIAIAPSSSSCGGTPNESRSSGSPWKTPNSRAPNPASSAANSSVMIDIDASIVQYGAGHASVPAPRPVAALSGSE